MKDGVWTAIYQNGELFLESGPGAEMASIDQMPISTVIFGSATEGVNSYNGLIDEISVWDGALDQDEIFDVMEDGPLPPIDLEPRFVRGDTNADAQSNITDGVFVLNFLFGGAAAVDPPCDDAADANNDGTINIADGVFVLNFLFAAGPDPTDDDLGCADFPPCP